MRCAKGVEGNTPTLPEIRLSVFSETTWTELQAKTQPFAVIHSQWEYPSLLTTHEKSFEYFSFIGAQGQKFYFFKRNICTHAQFAKQPTRSETINVSIPYLTVVSEGAVAKSLKFNAILLGQSYQP
jgi:hypothetical protein